jgi:proline dehydrogenase
MWSSNVEEMIRSIDVAGDFEDSKGAKGAERKTWVAFKLVRPRLGCNGPKLILLQSALLRSADSLSRLSSYLLDTRPFDRVVHYPGTPRSTDLDVLKTQGASVGSPLTAEDIISLRRLKVDLERICARAEARGIRVRRISLNPEFTTTIRTSRFLSTLSTAHIR